MKTLGGDQLLKMKFERLPVSDKWYPILGRIAAVFMACVYGESGEGKTEFCALLAAELANFGAVAWIGYETGHAADIQDVVVRNNLNKFPISYSDPWQKLTPCTADFPQSKEKAVNALFGDLVNRMMKKKSPKYWFIDSADATRFTEEQIIWLRAKFGTKKGIIFIAHAKGRVPEKAVSKKIEFYGHIGIYVKSYIAYPEKNRFSGRKPFIIWEEEARLRNPLFFEKQEAGSVTEPPKTKRTKKVKA